MVRCGLVQRRTDVHSVLEPFVPDVGMLHVGSAVSVPFLVAFRFGFVSLLRVPDCLSKVRARDGLLAHFGL